MLRRGERLRVPNAARLFPRLRQVGQTQVLHRPSAIASEPYEYHGTDNNNSQVPGPTGPIPTLARGPQIAGILEPSWYWVLGPFYALLKCRYSSYQVQASAGIHYSCTGCTGQVLNTVFHKLQAENEVKLE